MHLRHSSLATVSPVQKSRTVTLYSSLLGILTLLSAMACWAECPAPRIEIRLAIFSGHTARSDAKGTGRGAKSASGVYEFRFNDTITGLLAQEKVTGISFVIIPATRNIPLRKRVALAKRLNADAIIEIHHDSVQPRIYDNLVKARFPDPLIDRYRGFSLHVYPDEDSIALASAIENRMIAAGLEFSVYHQEDIPGERMELVPGTKAVYKRPNLHLPRTASIPAVILECGCIANPEEEKLLTDPEYQRTIVRAIRRGIEDYVANRRPVSVPEAAIDCNGQVFRLP